MGQAQYIPFKSANQFISHVKLYKNIYMPLERVDFFSFHKFDWIINFPLQCCQWVGIFKLYYMNMNKYFFFMSITIYTVCDQWMGSFYVQLGTGMQLGFENTLYSYVPSASQNNMS
jgi:hypothetical protein